MRRRALALLAAGWLVLGLAPVAGAATTTWVDFGAPSASSSFEAGVEFRQPVTVSKPAGRVELLLTSADAIGPTVVVVPGPPTTGSATLTYRLDPADGHILANTPMVARWRLIAADDPTQIQLGPDVRITYADDRFTWKTETGGIVTVHWIEGSDAFGKRALKIAQDAIAETSKLLGVTETEPVEFDIYADETAFRDAIGPGLRENVGGLEVPGLRTLFALIPPSQIDDAWVGIVIPHELTHLVFNTASKNPYHSPPHWLNEGVAVYVSQGYDASDRKIVRDAAAAGSLIPLDGLIGQFPTTADRFSQGYAEAVSAVDYLVRTHGTDALVGLIRSYADGRTDDEAFKAAVGVDMTAFADAWLADLKAKPPTRFGPQPAPSGPVPAAWNGAAGGVPPSSAPGNVGLAPAPSRAASAVSAAAGAAVADVPAWMPPLVALIGVIMVILLVVAARRNRLPGGPP